MQGLQKRLTSYDKCLYTVANPMLGLRHASAARSAGLCSHKRPQSNRLVVVPRVATPSTPVATKKDKKEIEGPSTDLSVIYERLQRVRGVCRSCGLTRAHCAMMEASAPATIATTTHADERSIDLPCSATYEVLGDMCMHSPCLTCPACHNACVPAPCSLCCLTGWRSPRPGGA
jgi:hypothetical protein